MSKKGLSPALKVSIVLGIITAMTSIIVALIGTDSFSNLFSYPTPTITFTLAPTLTPTLTPTPTPTLTPTPILTPTSTPTPTPVFSPLNLLNADSTPLTDNDHAPYDVLVKGNVKNAKGLYLYLIVDDGHKQWIQKPIGVIPDDDFDFPGHCYLGASKDDPKAKNQTFVIYAVISENGSYQEHHDFTNQIPIKRSGSITLVRSDPT